ncbi:MarR family transcriptional regulator [Temperatibacter marinus]|uniref:MarR family transcriptional regulator n=1 Tax=Temperatibacter marinus TaxID=1456591 RepID=A0AA52ED86_9PROT|nr:MarR family transcriptional regulator [Temperatibacter marinus]WND03317.1 MarR family transcriptional regulator [Temperatibacter marinus]
MTHKTSQQLLHMWHRAMIAGVRADEPDLTMRQICVILSVYLKPEEDHTVRGLAKELGVAKPVITRALDSLGQMGLLKRKRDERDKRNVLVQRTVKGSVYLSELSDRIFDAADDVDDI